MPYITQKNRELYNGPISEILFVLSHREMTDAAGDFTYIIYRLLMRFRPRFWMRALGIGCLICAILELYRRDHAEYEDEKIQENGDVYDNPK